MLENIIQRSDWRMRPYYAEFRICGLKPQRSRSIILPALCEMDAKLSIMRLSGLIGYELTIITSPRELAKGLYEGTFICPQEVDYDLWSPLHYDYLAWRADGRHLKTDPEAPADGRHPHALIV